MAAQIIGMPAFTQNIAILWPWKNVMLRLKSMFLFTVDRLCEANERSWWEDGEMCRKFLYTNVIQYRLFSHLNENPFLGCLIYNISLLYHFYESILIISYMHNGYDMILYHCQSHIIWDQFSLHVQCFWHELMFLMIRFPAYMVASQNIW